MREHQLHKDESKQFQLKLEQIRSDRKARHLKRTVDSDFLKVYLNKSKLKHVMLKKKAQLKVKAKKLAKLASKV